MSRSRQSCFVLALALVSMATSSATLAQTLVKGFDYPGNKPRGGVVAHANGSLYGTHSEGGLEGAGTIFQYIPGYRTVAHFRPSQGHGFDPRGALTLLNGSFYGVTYSGRGASQFGTVYRFDLPGTITTIASFSSGRYPATRLLALNGYLYGTTESGGTYGWGTVFRCDPIAQTITTLASFDRSTTGATPVSGLVAIGNALYGTTSEGDFALSSGTIYKVDLSNNNALTALATNPGSWGGELLVYNSQLYGTSYSGGANGYGTIFRVNPASGALTVLYSFVGGATGRNPATGLVPYGSKLYGTTRGAYSAPGSGPGVVYEFDPVNNTITNAATLGQPDGFNRSSLAVSFGTLVGTTSRDGGGGPFVYDPATNAVLTANEEYSSGWAPTPVIEKNGSLYGMTRYGPATGSVGYGSIFKIAADGSFSSQSLSQGGGGRPAAGFIESGGYLYGLTTTGRGGCGGVLRVDPATLTTMSLLSVPGSWCGTDDPGGPLLEHAGYLWGTSYSSSGGPDYGNGIVFRIDLAGPSITTVATFNGANGQWPIGGLVAHNGYLYGLTNGGGASSYGTIYEINPANPVGSLRTVYSFACGANGRYPYGELHSSGGFLWGTTSSCGTSSGGTIFKVDPSNNTLTTVHTFDSATASGRLNGYQPQAGLTARGSLFYGTTAYGGAYGYGTVFSFDPATSTRTTLWSFNDPANLQTLGAYPSSGLKLIGSHLVGASGAGYLAGGGNVFSTNKPPDLTPAATISRTIGTPASVATIGIVSDADQSPDTLTFSVPYLSSVLTASNIASSGGTVTASIGVRCGATPGTFRELLYARDNGFGSDSELVTINAAANPAPTLGTYPNISTVAGTSKTSTPSAAPADNGSIASLSAVGPSGFTGGFSTDPATGAVTVTNPNAGTYTITVTATDNCGSTTSGSFTISVSTPFGAPQGVSATASSQTSVAVSWIPVSGNMVKYEVQRRSSAGGGFSRVWEGFNTTVFTDTPVAPNGAYVYRVIASITDPFVATSQPSKTAGAHTFVLSDDPLAAGARPKPAHVLELRAVVNGYLAAAGLNAASFTDPVLSAGMPMRAAHLNELRNRLTTAYQQLDFATLPSWAEAIVAGSTVVRASHIQELRNALR